jgi:hypothetical protein
MKKHLLLLLVFGLASLLTAEQAQSQTVRRVKLQVTNPTVFSPHILIVAAEGVGGVDGRGTDLLNDKEGAFCDIHFNDVKVEENSAELIGSVVEADNPGNFGAFVKITAHTDGTVNFVFQALTPAGAQTGPAGISMTGTVTISTVLP